ncbi:MAG: class 1 fructose-bisphosphatase [Acidobacteria bacterium]|nr:MAG: class 1 fructose-bisphosphatase [Acidobacteriota bacterium]
MQQRPMTLVEHIEASERRFPEATGAFTVLMQAIGLACKIISREVNQAGLGKLLGLAGRTNVQGEQVARLDEFANDTLVRTLTRSGSVCALGSEELAVPIRLPPAPETGHYAVVFDPLDGSSNIDVAVSVGTIFGVFRRRSPAEGLGGVEDLLQPASSLVAAGYAIYGSSTVFVYSTGLGVHGFTLDPSLGELLLSHENIRVPARGPYYSCNTGYRDRWPEDVARAVSRFEDGSRSLRYVGSLVADAHRTLLRGGIFIYPPDRSKPEGKLRLLYEAAPLAFLFEQAGGRASDGRQRITEKVPAQLHDRTPLVLGGSEDVALYESALAGDAS